MVERKNFGILILESKLSLKTMGRFEKFIAPRECTSMVFETNLFSSVIHGLLVL